MTAKFQTQLADGREFFYFDDAPGKAHPEHDTRVLEPAASRSRLRFDPIQSDWVVVASHRQTRTHLPKTDDCPLCPSTSERSTEIPGSDYDVVVFENRFPSLASGERGGDGGEPGAPSASTPSVDWEIERPGVGRCEVICFSSDHEAAFSKLPLERLATIGRAWVDRTAALSRLPGVEYVFCFENRGEEIGVTLSHPHGQLYAYPFVPPRVRRALDSARKHRELNGDCLICAVLKHELAARHRIVAESEHFVAFVPWAPRWPFEVHLYSRRHVPDLPALSESELRDALALQALVLNRLDAIFDVPMPYIAGWVQAPVAADRELSHLRLEIFSLRRAPNKLKYLAGSESSAGVFINDVLPEEAARLLREGGPSVSSRAPGQNT